MRSKILGLVMVGMFILLSKVYAFYLPDYSFLGIPPGSLSSGFSERYLGPNIEKLIPNVSLEGPYKDVPVITAQQQPGGPQVQEFFNLNIDAATAVTYLESLKPFLSPEEQKALDELIAFLKAHPQAKVGLSLVRKGDNEIGLNIMTGDEGNSFFLDVDLIGDKALLDGLMQKWEEVKKNIDNNGQLTPQGKQLLDDLFKEIKTNLQGKKITLQNAEVNKTVKKTLDPVKDKEAINKIVNATIEYLKKNGLGNQAENMRKEIESALKTNGVKVSSIESYTNGKQTRSDLMITGANLDYRVLAGYNEKGEVNFGEMSKQDNQNHQTYVLSVEKSQVFPGETKEEAAKRYFLKNFGITDPANHAQLKNVWTQIVNNWGNWTISSENTFTSTLEGRNGKVNLTFTYGGQKIQLSFDYTISGKKPGN